MAGLHEWEIIDAPWPSGRMSRVYRLAVPGGWVYDFSQNDECVTQFVPDPTAPHVTGMADAQADEGAQARIDRALAVLRGRVWVADGEDPDPADFVSMDADCERAIAILEGGE